MNKKLINGLLFAAVAASGAAHASITSETTIDFGTGSIPAVPTDVMFQSSYSGFANNAPIAGGNCNGSLTTDCIYQNGMVVGTIEDTSNANAHLHRVGVASNRALGYHSDSSGIYVRVQDSTAFSLTSMDFRAPIDEEENPDAGGNNFWEILGYSSALNPGLDIAANSGPWIARKTVDNGFDGNLVFDSAFSNISAFWIHYNGYQQTPADGKQFGMRLDNVIVNAPAAVPVPAAVWMFLSGMMGLLALGKKRAKLAA